MKNKKAKKQQQGVGETITRLLGIGTVDLSFKLNLEKEDLAKAELEFDNINSMTQLKYLSERQDIWKTIKVLAENHTLNTFFYMNKCNKKKAFIDYVPYGLPTFSDDEKFIGDMIKYVTEQNYCICINDTPIIEGARYCYSFHLTCEDKEKTITLGTSKAEADKQKAEEEEKKKQEQEADCKKKEEEKLNNEQQPQQNEQQPQAQEEQQPQEQKTVEEEKQQDYVNKDNNCKNDDTQPGNHPEIQNKDSPLAKINMKCTTYNMFYADFNDILSVSIAIDDFVDLLIHLKTRSSPAEVAISFPNFSEMSNDMLKINRVLMMTDIYLFNLKEATESFNSHYNVFTQDNSKKTIDERKTYDYFISGIARGGGNIVFGNKLALFFDEFNKMTIVEASKKHADKNPYDCQPYPKVNHNNLKQVEEYRKLIQQNYDLLRGIFLGGFLIQMASSCGKGKSQDVVYPSFLVGLEMVKRIIELVKNGIPISDDEDFFIVKLSKAKIEEDLKNYHLGSKEGGFVLDCVNKEKSTMKDYMPLYDYHLNSFFSSSIIRKDLKTKGFIDSKGFVMYDPVYRSVMGASCRNAQNEQNKKEMDEKVLKAIQGINVANDYKSKEVDTRHKVLRSKSPTNNKIPLPTVGNEYSQTKADVKKSDKEKNKIPQQTTEMNETKKTQAKAEEVK